jgi:hypothetical protein
VLGYDVDPQGGRPMSLRGARRVWRAWLRWHTNSKRWFDPAE